MKLLHILENDQGMMNRGAQMQDHMCRLLSNKRRAFTLPVERALTRIVRIFIHKKSFRPVISAAKLATLLVTAHPGGLHSQAPLSSLLPYLEPRVPFI
jgi:hypothetical protein